jgi:glutaredoxin/glutathione-dependent peroxiredoxin
MTIKVGDMLPDVTFRTFSDDGPKPLTTAEVFSGKRMVLFAVPGAFTPTCNNNHLPGYLAHREAILAKNIDGIAVTGVNDPFVMKAWAEATGGRDKLLFLADGSADFAKAIGLELDASAFGLGIRSKRYAMVVDNGEVKSLVVEDAPSQAAASGAEALLATL